MLFQLISKVLDPAQKVDGNQDMNKFSLEFKDKRIEKSYREYRIELFSSKFIYIIIVLILLLMAQSILDAVVGLDYDEIGESMYIFYSFLIYSRIFTQFISICLCFALTFKNFKILQINAHNTVNIIYHYLIPFFIINSTLYSIFKGSDIDIINNAFIVSVLNWDSVPPPIYLSYSVCLFDTIRAAVSIFNSSKFGTDETLNRQNQFLCLIAYLIYIFHSFSYFFYQERARRNIFSTKNRIKYEENEVDHVLANLLPPFVRTRFNSSGNASIEEDQGEVAILFLDICDFDSILNEEQAKLIKWVDNLYRQFDKICVEYGVQKIETVGKIYMACAGLKLTKEERMRQQKMLGDNETKRLLLSAQEMQIKAKQYFWGLNLQTEVKIGIHYGKVIAGVIGAHKPQFSLIGDTVNTASRVCSNCKKSRISLSDEAYQRLGKTEWLFIEREVEAKGKGILKIHSLAENIRNTLIKVNNDQKMKNNQKFFGGKNEAFSRNTINNSIHSQNISVQSGTGRSQRNSFDNGAQTQVSCIQPNTILQRNNTIQRSPQKKNKTFVSSIDLNNELAEFNANDELNSSYQKQNQNNDSLKFQNSPNNVSINQVAKRKQRHSSTMLVQPRSSLQNVLAVQKLDTLEVNDEEEDPETKIYIEEERRENNKLSRKDTIVFTNKQKYEKESSSNAQEPMLKVSRYLLRYLNGNDDIVKKFELSNSIESSQHLASRSHVIQFCIHVLVLVLVFLNLGILSTKEQILLLIFKAIECGISLLLILIFPKVAQKVILHKIFLQTYVIISHINSILLSFYFIKNEGILNIIFIEHICVLNMIQNFSFAHFISTFPHAIIVMVLWTFTFFDIDFKLGIIKICILIPFELYKCYVRWDVKIENFNNLVAHEIKKSEKDNLIKYLVPKHILTQFLQNKKQYKEISEQLEKVTLLFADIAGFTSYSSNKHPSEVVHMLRNLFTSFDQLCLKHKVYKVYTIGDCYVVLGIVDKYNRSYHEECRNVVEMGFSMIQVIENIKRQHEDFRNVSMRIGIHLGEKILGGIIGTNIVRYDIFGKDVVIANKQ